MTMTTATDFDIPANFDLFSELSYNEKKIVQWNNSSRWEEYTVSDMSTEPIVLRSDEFITETCSFFIAACPEYRGKLIIKMVDFRKCNGRLGKQIVYAEVGELAKEDCGSFSQRREDRQGLMDYVDFIVESYRRYGSFRQLPQFEIIQDDMDDNFNPIA